MGGGGGYSYSSSSASNPIFGTSANLGGGLNVGGVSLGGGGNNQMLIYFLVAAVGYLIFFKQ